MRLESNDFLLLNHHREIHFKLALRRKLPLKHQNPSNDLLNTFFSPVNSQLSLIPHSVHCITWGFKGLWDTTLFLSFIFWGGYAERCETHGYRALQCTILSSWLYSLKCVLNCRYFNITNMLYDITKHNGLYSCSILCLFFFFLILYSALLYFALLYW